MKHKIMQIVENNQYNANFKNPGNISCEKKGSERKDEKNETVIQNPTTDQNKWFTFNFYTKDVQHVTKFF
jgi:hypothetical protein